MRRTISIATAALLAVALFAAPAAAARGGQAGSPILADAIWADGDQYGTILQKNLPFNGHVDSYDRLFVFPDGEQGPVSEAAPGNHDYNGGRWLPTPVTWNTTPYLLTSHAAVHAAAADGDITVHASMTDAAFLCPLIPNH